MKLTVTLTISSSIKEDKHLPCNRQLSVKGPIKRFTYTRYFGKSCSDLCVRCFLKNFNWRNITSKPIAARGHEDPALDFGICKIRFEIRKYLRNVRTIESLAIIDDYRPCCTYLAPASGIILGWDLFCYSQIWKYLRFRYPLLIEDATMRVNRIWHFVYAILMIMLLKQYHGRSNVALYR